MTIKHSCACKTFLKDYMQADVDSVPAWKGRHKYLQHIPINLRLGHQEDVTESAQSSCPERP